MAESLPIMEHFYTIQGEGAFTGHAAYFIRLGGCTVGCVWCDVKESWDASQFQQYTIDEIVDLVQKHSKTDLVVITGGEPAMYDLSQLTSSLKQNGYRIHIETSGSFELSGEFDWVCVSPKKFLAPLDSALAQADELKVIVYNSSDFEWAKSFHNRIKVDCSLYLQPEWSRHEQMQGLIVEFIKQNPEWLISLQTHKYLHID